MLPFLHSNQHKSTQSLIYPPFLLTTTHPLPSQRDSPYSPPPKPSLHHSPASAAHTHQSSTNPYSSLRHCIPTHILAKISDMLLQPPYRTTIIVSEAFNLLHINSRSQSHDWGGVVRQVIKPLTHILYPWFQRLIHACQELIRNFFIRNLACDVLDRNSDPWFGGVWALWRRGGGYRGSGDATDEERGGFNGNVEDVYVEGGEGYRCVDWGCGSGNGKWVED
jgi:hypothetical protein